MYFILILDIIYLLDFNQKNFTIKNNLILDTYK